MKRWCVKVQDILIRDFPQTGGAGTRRSRRGLAIGLLGAALGAAQAADFVPVQTFYVPVPEDQRLEAMVAIAGGRTGDYAPRDPIHSVLSIAVFANDTQIHYDQWEDGFDPNIAKPLNVYAAGNPGGTQIWGDGDAANGYPPGFPDDTLNAGDVIRLTNTVVSATRGAAIGFDGGDKLAASRPVAVTRMGWATGSGTSFAGANEVYDTAFWGTAFQCPVGTDISDAQDYQMFEYAGLSIMAGAGGATVQVDADADGTFETNAVLAEGQAFLVNGGVRLGGRVAADKPVQVDLITADVYDYYESRFIRLLPTAFWSSSLTTPVSTPATVTLDATTYTAGTTVWLYNPDAAPLALLYLTRSGAVLSTNALTVPGGAAGGYLKQVITSGYGARFVNTNGRPFYAVATVDSTGTDLSESLTDNGDNRNWDWGFALVPDASLTPQVLVGFGVGQDPTEVPATQNGNPVWVTPVGNGNSAATIYVDYDSDPTTGALSDPEGNRYDVAYSARELEQVKILNPAGDQSGLLAYVLGTGVKLAAAWGPDPSSATTSSPGIDLGTGIPPFPLFVAQKRSALLVDSDLDGYVSPGDTLRYSITIENTGRQPVAGLDLLDVLPPGITYQPGTTLFLNASAATNGIADNLVPPAQTRFPLDEGGIDLPEPYLPVRGRWEVQYTVRVDPYDSLPDGVVNLQNTARVGSSGLMMTNTVVTPIYARVESYVWRDANEDGLQSAGEPGIGGVTVSLLNADGSPALDDQGVPVVAVTTTNALGEWGYVSFRGVLPGAYRLQYLSPDGLQPTRLDSDAAGLDGETNSDAEVVTGITPEFVLRGGQAIQTVDAGFVERSGIVAGYVRLDADGDGVSDAEDTLGLAGVTLQLVDAAGAVVAAALTSATGAYTFGDVRPGAYTVVQLVPAGYTNTADTAGANDGRIPLTMTAAAVLADNVFLDARFGAVTQQGKVLYLSDPGQSLDRIDPAASGDTTTANTASLTVPASSNAVITVVGAAASSSNSLTASSHSFNYDSGTTGDNRILMVGISFRNHDGETVASVTYGGAALTRVGTGQNARDARVEIYRLLNPPTGVNVLTVTWDSELNRSAVVGAVTYAGVDQTAPNGTFVASSGLSRSPAVLVSSAAGQLAFGVVGGRTTSNYSVTSGGTLLWSERPSSGQTSGAGQAKAGASASVSLSWSGSNDRWAAGGVSLLPASVRDPGNPVVAFTQSPAFTLPFALSAGTVVSVTNYVDVTAGTMPANPAATARLSVGDATFLTLSAPAYSSAAGALIWTGALSSNVSVAAGQALSFSVSNAQSGVAFRVRYDSAASPSKIVLPTSTVIAVPSLSLYDAPYPGGVPVTQVTAGATCYVRALVTDPFGAYDITGATLSIGLKGRGGPDSQSLDDAHVVASNAWSKTYESAWDAPAFTAEAQFGLVAHEGSEGIQASASASVNVAGRSLYGFLFIDRNDDQIFNADDWTVTNVTVQLVANKKVISSTNSAVNGAYVFHDVPLGNVRLMTPLLPGAKLTGIPANASPMRNRAKEESGAAVIDYGVAGNEEAAAGQEALLQTEPLNFGFDEYPLSTALDLVAYASGNGVLVDLWTVNEAGLGDIVVYAWLGGDWVEVGRVPSEQVAGEGSNRYTLSTTGLSADGAYRFKVIDEAGHVHYSGGEIAVQAIRLAAVRLDMQTLTLTFNTEKGRRYRVKASTDLVNWSDEYASFPNARGWSAYSAEPFTANGTSIQIRVPVNGRRQAFFKVVRDDT